MKPIILNYTENRIGEINKVYHYDFNESLNIVNINNVKIPFIDTTSEDISMITHTRVLSEADDVDINVLEFCTKTKVTGESDDIDSHLLELVTKTFTSTESDDDESFSFY